MGQSSKYTFGIWQQASWLRVGGFKSFSTLEAMSLSLMIATGCWFRHHGGVNVVTTCHTYGATFAARLRTEAVVTSGQSSMEAKVPESGATLIGEVAISLYHML